MRYCLWNGYASGNISELASVKWIRLAKYHWRSRHIIICPSSYLPPGREERGVLGSMNIYIYRYIIRWYFGSTISLSFTEVKYAKLAFLHYVTFNVMKLCSYRSHNNFNCKPKQLYPTKIWFVSSGVMKLTHIFLSGTSGSLQRHFPHELSVEISIYMINYKTWCHDVCSIFFNKSLFSDNKILQES